MILGQSLFSIMKASIPNMMLVLASILAVALIIERFIFFTRNRFNADKGLAEFQKQLTSGGASKALTWAKGNKNPLGRMFVTALENAELTSEQLYGVLYGLTLRERMLFEKLLGGMGTLANAATLLGLLGTVTGLIRAFGNIAATGSGGPAVVAGGISEALLATAFGLFVGIPTLFFANYFSKKAADIASTLESTSDLVIVVMERAKGKTPSAS
ncbi:MAG TPA: MotA/TolQ/ExbB proton channel family protein [bacterium]|nr:MotA/TolQ/ExbB proton channel family protein [bacterium]